MKRVILIISLFTFTCVKASAQDFHLGVKAGLNLATLQPDLTDPATRTSIHFGGLIEVPVPVLENFSIQPELLYSSQGVKDESDDDEVIRLNYLTIPILAKYYVWETLSLEAGPQLGFLLSAEREDDGETEDLKDISKSMDIGFSLGAGYKLDNGFNFGARYYLGSDINSIEEDTDKIKNRVFQIFVGYYLPIPGFSK